MNMSKKVITIVSAALLLISFLMVGLLLGNPLWKKESGGAWQEQYDLGVRYLSEGKYEAAIITFKAAIELEPKNADAYVRLANVYISVGNIADATDILDKAMKSCDDITAVSDLLAKLEMGSFSYNLTLSGVRYTFEPDSEIVHLAGNEGAIGGVSVEFTVSAPENVVYADIELVYDLVYLEDTIRDMCEFGRGVPPMMVGSSDWWLEMPVFDEISEGNPYVVVFTFDSNQEFVGYSVIGTIGIGNDNHVRRNAE